MCHVGDVHQVAQNFLGRHRNAFAGTYGLDPGAQVRHTSAPLSGHIVCSELLLSLVLQREPARFGREEFEAPQIEDRKSTRLNSSHVAISYAVFCLKKKKTISR